MINFNFLNTKFSVSVGFVGLICLMLYIDRSGLILPSFIASLIHETGHIFCLFILKAPIEKIILKIGTAEIKGNFLVPRKSEIIMTFFGPFFNLLVFILTLLFYLNSKYMGLLNFSLINLILGVFNLLPISSLDGGTVLFLLLSSRLSASLSKKICIIISFITLTSLFALGLLVFFKTKTNPTLILLCIYLLFSILLSKNKIFN